MSNNHPIPFIVILSNLLPVNSPLHQQGRDPDLTQDDGLDGYIVEDGITTPLQPQQDEHNGDAAAAVLEKGCAIDTWYDGKHVSIIAVSSFYYCLHY